VLQEWRWGGEKGRFQKNPPKASTRTHSFSRGVFRNFGEGSTNDTNGERSLYRSARGGKLPQRSIHKNAVRSKTEATVSDWYSAKVLR